MESFPQEWKEKQVLQGWQLLNHDMLPSGEGGYGKVYKIAKEDTGETAALKWIRIKTDSKQQMSEAHRRLSTEIKVMYDMSSVPQIVHIQDYAIMDNEDELCVDALVESFVMTCHVPSVEKLLGDETPRGWMRLGRRSEGFVYGDTRQRERFAGLALVGHLGDESVFRKGRDGRGIRSAAPLPGDQRGGVGVKSGRYEMRPVGGQRVQGVGRETLGVLVH